MAIKSGRHPDVDRQERPTARKQVQTRTNGTLVTPDGSTRERLGTQDDLQVSSLSELTRLVQLESYQRRKCYHAQQHLYAVSVVAARTARLAHTARSVQRTLAECIRSEDKQGFVSLFNAFNDALSECYEPPGILQKDAPTEKESDFGYPSSFLDSLSTDSRAKLLEFLARTRQDSKFVADRLAALSHRDLIGLLPGNGLSRSDTSIFGSSPRSSLRTSKHLGFVVDGQTELLSSSEFCNPLETLVHSLRGISDGPLEDDSIATDVWATVCARLLSEQKPGSEKLIPAVIDIWSSSSSWPGKGRLEVWLLRTLQKGSFLLDQLQKQSFRVRLQARQEPAQADDNRLETFLTESVNSLLHLLADRNGASVIPEAVQNLCVAISNKLKDSHRHAQSFPNFVITRWLFSTFLLEAITLPEMHGLLSDYFISDNVRHRLLREIANRCQKAVFDVVYSWKHGGFIPEQMAQLVASLADRFRGSGDSSFGTEADSDLQTPHSSLQDWKFVALSAADVSALVNALYPPERPASLSERNPSYSGLQSSASSISGFSLFQNVSSADHMLRHQSSATLDCASTATDSNLAVTTPTCGYSSNLDAVAIHTELDGQRLREACIAIDDFLTSRRPPAADQWCTLLAEPLKGSLCTVQQNLDATESKVRRQTRSRHLSSCHRACRAFIEELLADGAFARSTALPESSMEQSHAIFNRIAKALNQRVKRLRSTADFTTAHSYSCKIRSLDELCDNGRSPQYLLSLLHGLQSDKQESLNSTTDMAESCERLLRSLAPNLESQSRQLLAFRDAVARLRDKMWYVADVRTSAIYDEARAITSALKAMGKAQQSPRTRPTATSRSWNGVKSSNGNYPAKTDAQVLELISAPSGYGGKGKLSDDYSKALSTWIERNAIENFCRGEERLHKLCMEVRKAVEQVTAEGSSLRSSTLFARDEPRTASTQSPKSRNLLWTLHEDRKRFDMLALHTDARPGLDHMSNGSSHPLSTRSSRDRLDSWSPSMTNRSSATFWSPVTTEARSPSSVTSIGSSQTQSALHSLPNKEGLNRSETTRNSLDQLRKRTTSLLLSDLATPLFANGSETDRAFWTGVGGELTARYLRNLFPRDNASILKTDTSIEGFDFSNAFEELASRFSTSCDPYLKLQYLLDIDTLLLPYMDTLTSSTKSSLETGARTVVQNDPKRQITSAATDVKVQGFTRLFCSESTRPEAVFRDLQYIAALVPSSTLESTAQGKAFWNAAAAMSSLKRGACNVMVETADSIIAHYSNNRGTGRSSSVAQRERDSAAFSVPNRSPSPPEDIGGRTMSDAALLLQITAKEGYPVAQRELATLYLTDPELMDHIIAPFSRPREVFKEELESKWRKNQDPTRCDPTTMCVAHHWMSLSSRGGDALATEFLRQREEMERLP